MNAPEEPRQADYLEGLMEGFVAYDAGWRMTYMNASAERLLACAAFRPDAVLLDIGLPGVSGLEICREIRAQPGGSDILIAALSGWGQEEDQLSTRAAGFDAHLVKPVAHEALLVLLSTSRSS